MMTEDTGKHKKDESMELTLIIIILLGCNTDLIGLVLVLDHEESQETTKTTVGGTEFQIQKEEDPQAIDTTPAYLQVLVLGEIRSQRSILEMIGKQLMGVNQELGMMLYLKMWQRSLSFC